MGQAFDVHSLEFRLPDLGEGLTEAEIVRWLVEVGDSVVIDQPVVEVETAKAMVEVPCPYGGVVTARFGEEGSELPVGAPLLTVAVGQPGGSGGPDAATGAARVPEQASAGSRTGAPGAGGGEQGEPGRQAASGEVAHTRGAAQVADAAVNGTRPTEGTADASGGRRTERSEQSADGTGQETARSAPATEEGSGNVLVGYGTGAAPARRRRVRPPDLTRARGPVPVISPLVRKLARDHNLDLRELAGSGPDGLILRADVEYAVRAAGTRVPAAPRVAAAQTAPTAPPVPTGGGGRAPAPAGIPGQALPGGSTQNGLREATAAERSDAAPTAPADTSARTAGGDTDGRARAGVRIPLRGVRGAVAEKLSRSRREIPEATCWVDADATDLLAARAAMNAAGGPKISLLALLARICTAALARHPELNSTVDTEAREIVRLDEVHLGFAAQTDRGLMVPVVKDAHRRDTESLSAELARLTGAAREGTLTPAELTGGTFTLNNYGVFGVDGSTPIINHPEAAMLGVGRIVAKPWVHQGELAVRQVVQLSLTFDHRVCDGGTAAGFLRFVTECVEQPAVLLRTL